jgi:glycosyltransferase involved in cell wall biosynthesis
VSRRGPGNQGGAPVGRAPVDRAPVDRALVSVVVPTRDAARTITACLASVRSQTHRPIELIVVDNWSDDGTFELARRLADRALRHGPERSAQRNLGVAEARGEWILWLDADMELAPDAVERGLDAGLAAGAVGVFLPETTSGSGFWTRCRTLERRCYHGEPRIEAPRLLRTAWLRDAGGFLVDLTGTEDAAVRNRLLAAGATLAWADTMVVHHEGRLGLGRLARKRFYYGRSIPAYRRAHPGAVSGQVGATLGALWRHRRLLAADPAHAAGLLAMRGWEVAAYLAGALAGTLNRR